MIVAFMHVELACTRQKYSVRGESLTKVDEWWGLRVEAALTNEKEEIVL